MKIGFLIAVCALFASTGCVGGRLYPTYYNVHIDPAFADRVPDVIQALDDWSEHTNVVFNNIVENIACDDEDIMCISIHPASMSFITADSKNPDAIGLTHWHASFFSKAPFFSDYHGWGNSYVPEDFSATDIKHELGHAMGLQHLGPGNIMCPSEGCASADISCGDVNEYNELRNIPDIDCPVKQ